MAAGGGWTYGLIYLGIVAAYQVRITLGYKKGSWRSLARIHILEGRLCLSVGVESTVLNSASRDALQGATTADLSCPRLSQSFMSRRL